MEQKIIGNRYQIMESIGTGGMAEVYKAFDTFLNREVAVKILRAQYTDDDGFVSRFRQEAQSAARLIHPNIVSGPHQPKGLVVPTNHQTVLLTQSLG